MMSGGYEVDVEGEGSTLKYMNNESHALHREERNPHHCFASKFFSTLRKSCLFRTCPIYVHADFTRCSAAEYATQKPGPGGNLTRLSPACVKVWPTRLHAIYRYSDKYRFSPFYVRHTLSLWALPVGSSRSWSHTAIFVLFWRRECIQRRVFH